MVNHLQSRNIMAERHGTSKLLSYGDQEVQRGNSARKEQNRDPTEHPKLHLRDLLRHLRHMLSYSNRKHSYMFLVLARNPRESTCVKQ